MNIVIFGATGGTGQLIVLQALARQHNVTAIVRNPAKFQLSYPHLRVWKGDALKPESYRDALRDQDAVVSALGVSGLRNSLKPMTFHTDTASSLVREMEKANVARYIGITSVGVLLDPDAPIWYRLLIKPLLRHKYADMRNMEEAVEASSLGWTIVRPVQLVSGLLTETYRLGLDGSVPNVGKISREDLASFIVKSVDDESTFNRGVAISY